MRHDADEALEYRQLRAMMHLVLLRAEQELEATRRPAAGHSHALGEQRRRELLEPSGETFAFDTQQRHDLFLRSRLCFLGARLRDQRREVEAIERVQMRLLVQVAVEAPQPRD